jgi:hypothetical protein
MASDSIPYEGKRTGRLTSIACSYRKFLLAIILSVIIVGAPLF